MFPGLLSLFSQCVGFRTADVNSVKARFLATLVK